MTEEAETVVHATETPKRKRKTRRLTEQLRVMIALPLPLVLRARSSRG